MFLKSYIIYLKRIWLTMCFECWPLEDTLTHNRIKKPKRSKLHCYVFSLMFDEMSVDSLYTYFCKF